jgi:hypothetical protein
MEAVRSVEDAYNCTFIEAVKAVEARERQYPGELGSTQRAERAKQAERDRGARAVDAWNAEHPSGTRIAVRILRDGPEYETTTRSAAWALGDGSPMVLIEGRTGGWCIDGFVRALAEDETLPALPEKGQVAA